MAGILGGIMTAVGGRGAERLDIPDWKTLDLAKEQAAATAQNQANLPAATKLAGGAASANQDQIMAGLRRIIPDLDAKLAQISDIYGRGFKGEMSASDARYGVLQSVSDAIAHGYGPSGDVAGGMLGNRVARDYGLRQQDIIDRNVNSFQSWLGKAGQLMEPGNVNVTSSFISPMQRAQFDYQNQQQSWNVQMMKNVEAAKPSNLMRGLTQTVDAVDQFAAMAASYGLGGLMGGGGGGGLMSTNAPPPAQLPKGLSGGWPDSSGFSSSSLYA